MSSPARTIVVPLSGKLKLLNRTLALVSSLGSNYRKVFIDGARGGIPNEFKDRAIGLGIEFHKIDLPDLEPGSKSSHNTSVNRCVGKIYNYAAEITKTPLMVTLEDDVFPFFNHEYVSFDAAITLLVSELSVLDVSCGAYYPHRQKDYAWCNWNMIDETCERMMLNRISDTPVARRSCGHGFGFSVINTMAARAYGFCEDGRHVDIRFSQEVALAGFGQRVAKVRCSHETGAERCR